MQINRSTLAEHLNVFSPLWRLGSMPIENGIPVDRSRIIGHLMPFSGGWPFGAVPTDDPSKLIAMWGEELNRQAATIAYLNDFRVLADRDGGLHPAAVLHAPPGDVRAAAGSAIRRHGTGFEGPRDGRPRRRSSWCVRSWARISAWPRAPC